MRNEEAPGPMTQASAPEAPGRLGREGARNIAGPTTQFAVLVADDNEVAQRLCRRVLEKAGYPVLIAADGLQAVDIALNQHPAMILMDVAMPGIDGLEAMRRIKAQVPTMPIVIASAHSMSSDRDRFLAAGADDVLSKPFRLADLIAIVEGFAKAKTG